MTERVIVRTGDGQSLGELAAALIAVADDPHHVVWEHRAGVLTVPEYVAARYAAGVVAEFDEPDDPADDTNIGDPADAAAVEEPPKRKPGRPRKAAAAAVTEEVN